MLHKGKMLHTGRDFEGVRWRVVDVYLRSLPEDSVKWRRMVNKCSNICLNMAEGAIGLHQFIGMKDT